ncbi:MAG TPA: uroporphyrinogen-III C-methyltransferase [Burkholderiales bacterium]|nr:uroporphyrinogen-III C-methyltransferase [Burkholderiales bacterium]
MSGTVHLVGAGPGAADLLTVRAARLLGEADIVFHDALVPEDILKLCPGELVSVGKRCGKHSAAQRFINKRLLDAARRYRTVVRLKGGDPMMFGRAQEEISYLSTHGVRVEIVPGITAALAAGAELGISLTQRGIARSVVFATPRKAVEEAPSSWVHAVAAADTAVLYMAAGDAAEVREQLLSAGLRPHTPAAVAESVTLPSQNVHAGTLAMLPELAARCGGGPALVLLGDVFAGLQAAATRRMREPRTASHTA